ncbi:MAG TPA: glycosyltransferase family 39 protein [Anaerolineae bacterium]
MILLLLVLAAFALRVFHLGAQSLWYDEAFSVYLAQMSVGEIMVRTAADIQPPLYYLFLHFWMLLAGPSEFAVRFLSLTFGVLTVPLLSIVAKRLFNETAGIFAALLGAISALYLWYSQEARMYTLITFLGLLASYALLRVIGPTPAPSRRQSTARREGWLWWLVFTLANTAALYTHYFAVAIITFQFLFALGAIRDRLGSFAKVVFGFIVSFIAFVPWLPFVLTRLGEDASYWRGELKMDEAIRHIFINFALGESVLEEIARQITPWWLVVLFAGTIAYLYARRRGTPGQGVIFSILYLVVPLALLLLLFSRNPKFNARYLMLASPAFILLLAIGLSSWLALSLRGRRMTRIISGSALLLTSYLLLSTSAYADTNAFFDPAFTKPDFRGVANYIAAHATNQDAIILTSGHLFPAFDYYYRGTLPELRVPDDATLDTEHVLNYATANELNRALSGRNGAWVVMWQDEVTDPNEFIPYLLSTRATEIKIPAAFWQVKLRYWQFGANVTPISAEPEVQNPRETNFKNLVKLLGLSAPAPTSADVGASFVLHWQALAPLNDDYLASLRVLDAQGNEWGKLDQRPAGFNYPTMRWKLDENIIGNYTVPLLMGAPAGNYFVVVTLYTKQDQTGLDILAPNGAPVGRSVKLGPIPVLRAMRTPAYLDLKIQNTLEAKLGPLSLVGYSFGRNQASAGETIPLTLFWRYDDSLMRDYRFRLEFGGKPTVTFAPANEKFPTTLWQTGAIVRGQYRVPIPNDAASGATAVTLVLLDAGGGPVARSRLSDTFEVAKTDRVFVAPTPQANQLATFGANSLSLVGYDTSASTIRAGDKLTVTLYWKAGNKMDKPYTVFVHLLDKGSQVAAQRDAQPLNGARPTQTWVTGEYIADEYGLDVKPETGAGEYLIEIGWYDGGDPAFTRLQAFDERDNPIGDRVILKTGVAVR